jgi:hypothetical protein
MFIGRREGRGGEGEKINPKATTCFLRGQIHILLTRKDVSMKHLYIHLHLGRHIMEVKLKGKNVKSVMSDDC